jgi:hypothetical protein
VPVRSAIDWPEEILSYDAVQGVSNLAFCAFVCSSLSHVQLSFMAGNGADQQNLAGM